MRLIFILLVMAALAVLFYVRPWQGDRASQMSSEGKTSPAVPVDSPYVTPQDQFLTISGATVRIRDEGPKDAPVLILLHGFTFSLESFDGWADRLSSDYRVIRYDLLGHGLTGPDPEKRYSPEARVAFLGEVMDALGIQKAHIAGNSLGGLVAWRFASQYPDRVNKVILVSPAAFSINGVTDKPAPIPPAMAFYLKTAPEAGIRASLAFVYADDTKITPERVALARAMLTHKGNGQAFIEHLEQFTLPDPTEDLTRVKAETLLMWGVQDALIPSVHGSMMVDAMPNATLKMYALAGHVAQEELPDETATDAMEFLATRQQ
ncbi:MAG: alpha/beta fold hydrolase [Parvularcula sp.]